MSHLLVTNDFPPKIGGIQAYLWELWRRLDPSSFTVLTASSHPDAAHFDAAQAALGVRIERTAGPVLLPTPAVVSRVRSLAKEVGASLVVLDPVFPLAAIGPSLGVPYAVVLHGAEVTVPGRLAGARQLLAGVLRRARLVVCAGDYVAAEARRVAGADLEVTLVPPGVDLERFRPLSDDERAKARAGLQLRTVDPVVLAVSRLVARKGLDVLVDAVAALEPSFPGLTLAIGGRGRCGAALDRRARSAGAPVRMLGAIPDVELPLLYGAADVFAVPCRNRWFGLEQEGFGIVFLEAAAAGVPQVAGSSGGAGDAVVDGSTGFVVDDPTDRGGVARALRRLLVDPELRRRMGVTSRRRAEASFGYDRLARRLADALADAHG